MRLAASPSAMALAALGLLIGQSFGAPAAAQGLLSFGNGDQPIEITADDGIEWRQTEKVYIASGNARAARGDLELYGDSLAAYYRPAADGGSEVYRVEAHGNVRIISTEETVYGDDGYYDVDEGVVVLTGDNLRLETGGDVITAKESLEYWEEKQVAVARGDAEAIRDDKSVKAAVLVGHFQPNEEGRMVLHRVDAQGNVRITTPSEFVRSNNGIYHIDRDLAELIGDVKITRDDTQLNGEYAEVNLATGVSRLLAAPPGGSSDTRVHGLVLPESKGTTSDNDS